MNYYRRNNNIIVITVAIFLIVVSTFIYNFYFKDYGEYNKTEEKKESLYTTVTDENIINELLNTININKLYNVAAFEKNIDNMNALEPIEKLSIAYNAIKKDNLNEIDVINLDEYFKNAFKTTIYYDKSDIYCVNGEVLYKFDMALNKYIYNNEHNCENHNEISPAYTNIVNVKKKSNTYVITVDYIWRSSLHLDTMYGSYKDTINEKDMLLVVPSEEVNPSSDDINEFIDNSYNDIKDKLHKYTYVFEKKEDNYLLESVKFD